ncbi:MAG: hypothetical protein ACI9EB_001715 [Pseudomonas sp.]|jgi:hypothetical protein
MEVSMKKWMLLGMLFWVFQIAPAVADVRQLGQNYFVAGVPSEEFDFFAAPQQNGRQRQSNWCWAATTQMVLNYHGLYVTQEDIVSRIFGGLIDSPGQPEQILIALSGWAPDARGRFSQIYASPYILQGSEIVNDLTNKWPLIVGLKQPSQIGHAYVLTAVYFSADQYNQPIFDRVVLRDPWPNNPSRLEMSWNEFQSRVLFAARVHVQRL